MRAPLNKKHAELGGLWCPNCKDGERGDVVPIVTRSRVPLETIAKGPNWLKGALMGCRVCHAVGEDEHRFLANDVIDPTHQMSHYDLYTEWNERRDEANRWEQDDPQPLGEARPFSLGPLTNEERGRREALTRPRVEIESETPTPAHHTRGEMSDDEIRVLPDIRDVNRRLWLLLDMLHTRPERGHTSREVREALLRVRGFRGALPADLAASLEEIRYLGPIREILRKHTQSLRVAHHNEGGCVLTTLTGMAAHLQQVEP